jgi:hypothetical protein
MDALYTQKLVYQLHNWLFFGRVVSLRHIDSMHSNDGIT